MKKGKRLLIMLCLSCGLLQAPAAQAQVAEALVGIGFKLIPVVAPMALMAIPMIPTLVRQMVPPMPHLGRRKAADDSQSDPQNPDQSAGEGTENATNESSPAEESTVGSGKAESRQARVSEPVDQVYQEPVAVNQRVSPKDNSEWFMEEDKQEAAKQPANSYVAEKVKAPVARRAPEPRATEVVKGKVLNPAAPVSSSGEKNTPPVSSSEQARQSEEEKSSAAPVIMMKVAE